MFVSFDFWNTLATPNPDYRIHINEFLEKNFGENAEKQYTILKRGLNEIAETTSECKSTYDICKQLIDIFDVDFDVDELVDMFQRTALKYQPIIDPEIYTILSNKNLKCAITSNTDFIMGSTLMTIMNDRIDFVSTVFSDQFGIYKPHPEIFNETYNNFIKEYPNLNKNEIIHVGDSYACDIVGSKNYGFCSIHVENPQSTLNLIKEMI